MQPFMILFNHRPLVIRTLEHQYLVKCRVGWFLDQAAKDIGRNIFFAGNVFNNSIIVLNIEFPLENFPGAMVI